LAFGFIVPCDGGANLYLGKLLIVLLCVALAPTLADLPTDRLRPPRPYPADARANGASAAALAPPSSGFGARTSIALGGNISDLVVDPIRPRAYAADRLNNRVYALDLDNGTVLATIPVRAEPTALAVLPSGGMLYVGHGSNRSIMAIDLGSLAVVRTFETTFLTWDMVAPDGATLVATTHDDQWSGEYPYVLNASDGSVIQRPCWSQLACNTFYQDTIVALTPDTSLLFFGDTLGYPTALYDYQRSVGGRWSFIDDNRATWGEVPGGLRDIAASPDDQYLYLATAQTSVLKVRIVDFHLVQTFGSYRASSAVVLAASGHQIAMSAGDATIHVFADNGTLLWNIFATAPINQLTLTPDGKRFVAVVGGSTVETYSASPPSTPTPPLSAETRSWVLLWGLIATATEGTVLGLLVFRERRHRP